MPALVLALLLLLSGTTAGQAIELTVLSYNVQNLPGADFDERAPELLNVLGSYDLIVLQEDFAPDGLYSRWPGRLWRGPGPRWRWHNVLAPLARPWGYRAPYDSGLTILAPEPGAQRPAAAIEPLLRMAFDDCHGIVSHSHDCWANKGLLGVRVTLVTGAGFDLYTTHLDAGGGPGDREARMQQFEQMRQAIAEQSAGRAIVFAGDFNTPRRRPEHHADLLDFKAALGLSNSGIHPSHGDWSRCQVDFILIRDGDAVSLEVIDGGEPAATTPGAGAAGVDFCDGDSWRGQALSDHPALAVQLRIRSAE
ncbi:MAG: endonuclease/exonuclease/phosphatase family protein [Gammaproteobacteria bacterium]|nr:endonuclease/exonuclease/phosphatase family protein [Gammaproteobacteria bacterium]